MCFFPKLNTNFKGVAYKRGLTHFDCGYCPECRRKKAGVWALRAVYEAREHVQNMMLTLTYDNYIRDNKGRIVGETDPDRDLHVCKRDIQLFIKRLRKFAGVPLKYIVAAEYGKKTHRAHYHVIIFGFCFSDCVRFKKSKRGNWISRSSTLEKLWSHGICTVDSVRVNESVARYCTKYTMKGYGAEDTFMLFSHEIGLKGLLRDFNGVKYVVEGRFYPIPKLVWAHVLTVRYQHKGYFTYKYKNRSEGMDVYVANREMRRRYRAIRNSDIQYINYLRYWKGKAKIIELLKKPLLERILDLDERKFHFYKIDALNQLERMHKGKRVFPPLKPIHLPVSSCLIRANDTTAEYDCQILERSFCFIKKFSRNPKLFLKKWLTEYKFCDILDSENLN